ncbi:MAG: AsmA-like C-terminal domain-containing protein, partial [Desulfobacterales bacterium]
KIVIEQAVLPEIDLAEPPATVEAFLTGINMTAQVSGVSLQPSPDLPKIEGIAGRITFENGALATTDMRARVGPLSLPDVSIRVTHITEQPKVTVRVKGPLQIEASSDEIAAKLLMAHGLKSLSGSTVVDMRADFELRKPKSWVANGSFVFNGVRAETYPEAVVMDNLEGNVKFNRNKTINITALDITAQINQAPVRLSGKLLKVGTPNPVVDAKVFTKQLDLAHLGQLIPALKKTGLAGKLDLDLDIYIPYATPAKGRLNGTLATKNVQFKLATYDVKHGDTELTLAGNTAKINRLQIQVNDLALAATGHITNPVEPDIFLVVELPNLDIDRLLPPAKSEKRSSKVPPKEDTGVVEKTKKAELPPIARKSTAHLQFKARRGRYKGMKFQNLKLDAVYAHGVVKQYNLDLDIDDGRIATKGSADLGDPERVQFVLSPKVTSLRLETVAPVLGIKQLPISGPISLTGQLRGRTGTTRDLIASLDGKLETEMGPGSLNKIGKIGDMMVHILSLTSVKSILSGRLIDNLTDKGLSYQTIKARTTFNKGNLELNNFNFVSDAMNMDAQGSINLVDEQINIEAELKPLRAVGTALGMVPVLGKSVEELTRIHLQLKGSLDNPKIGVVLGQGVVDDVKGAKKKTGTILKGVMDFLKKENNKLLKK